ncbi:MAG: hypothetical protein GY765_11310 [bacterium]|nr:hypothetical protein [bacterium]
MKFLPNWFIRKFQRVSWVRPHWIFLLKKWVVFSDFDRESLISLITTPALTTAVHKQLYVRSIPIGGMYNAMKNSLYFLHIPTGIKGVVEFITRVENGETHYYMAKAPVRVKK